MRSYLSLVRLSGKAHKRRNRMTLICITIAVFLVTAIFSMANMGVRMEYERILLQHGDWHFCLKNMPEEKMLEIAGHPEVYTFSRYNVCNYALDESVSVNGKQAILCGTDKALAGDILVTYPKKSFPKHDREIALNSKAVDTLGVKKGDTVTLQTPYGTEPFTVSGFAEDNDIPDAKDVVGAFVTMTAYRELCQADPTDTGDTVCYVRLQNDFTARKVIDEIKADYDLTDDQIGENTALLGITGMSATSYYVGLYTVAAVLCVLVLLTGVFMISGSIHSNVAERTQFFGNLRCIGASKRQVRRMVRLEALNWCKTAIPAGLVLGIFISWGLCLLLHYGVGGWFGTIPLWQLSPAGLVAGVIVGLLSVYLAALAPARRAAKVPPIVAVNGTAEETGRKGVRNLSGNPNRALGRFYALHSGKNLFLLSGSFALCILVFLLFSCLMNWVDLAMPAVRDYAPDLSVSEQGFAPNLSKELRESIETQPEVKHAFGRMHRETETADVVSYDDLQFDWADRDVVKGDLTPVREGLPCVMTVFDKYHRNEKVGDTLTINGQGVKIAAILSESPFDADEKLTVICSESLFEQLFGPSNYSVIDIQLSEDAQDMDSDTLRSLLPESVRLGDYRDTHAEARSVYWAFHLFVYGFLMVLATISVFHIINSISMSTTAKTKRYGILRAIGLEDRQLRQMIASEGFTYAIFGLGAGAIVGIPLHHFAYTRMVTNYFGIEWALPWEELLLSAVVIIAATAVAVRLPARRMENLPVTEVIGSL